MGRQKDRHQNNHHFYGYWSLHIHFLRKRIHSFMYMVPQSTEGGSKLSGNLGGLAAMAGINLGSMGGGSTIPPTLYPKIISSIPFRQQLMNTQLNISGVERKVSYSEYYLDIYRPDVFGYLKKYTIGLPSTIISLFLSKEDSNVEQIIDEGLIQISADEKRLIKKLQKQVSIEVDKKEGHVTLSVRMPEAKAAAQMVNDAKDILQKAIVDFKIKKAKEQLYFIEQRFEEKKKEAKEAQERLALFRDGNKNMNTATAQIELQRLTSDYDLVYGVYSELAKQLEKQRIQVKEDAPVFTVIQPVSVPTEKSKPKRPLILVLWTLFGGMVGVGVVFGRGFLKDAKSKWNNGNTF